MKIALYRGSSLFNKITLFVSRGGYSHAAIILKDGTVYESTGAGVVCKKHVTVNTLKGSVIDIFDVKTTAKEDKIIEKFLKKQLGKKYDYVSLFGFVLHTTKEGRKQYGKWFCSELVFAAFAKAEVHLLNKINAWKVSPTILSYSPKLIFEKTIRI